MVNERADVFEVSQLGIETTLGSAVVATKKLTGTSIVNKIMTEVNTYRSRGSRFNNLGIENKEWTEGSWTADVASYTEPGYAFSGAFGAPDITTPGGGTLTRDWDWSPATFAGVLPKSLTFESGSYVRAGKSAGNIVKTVGFDFTRDGVSYSAESFGQLYTDGITMTPGTNEAQTVTKSGTVTSGSYTITFYGETTGSIAYDAVAATIQTAVEALANVGTGNATVTGGPVSTTPAVITFKGPWASQNVPLISVSSALLVGGGTYVPTETTPGVPLTELALKPISGNHWDLFVDTTAAGLGGTKLTRALSTSWNVSDIWGPLWVGNTSNPSWVNAVPLPPDTEFKMLLEADAAGMAFLTQLRAGTKIFPRIQATGDLIEGALFHRLQHDFCVLLTDVESFGEDQGITTQEYTGVITHDATWGKALRLNQRSTLTAL